MTTVDTQWAARMLEVIYIYTHTHTHIYIFSKSTQNNGGHLNSQPFHLICVIGITACDRLDGWGFVTWGDEMFHTCTDQPLGFPVILYNGYWGYFPGVKQPECGIDHPSTSSAGVRNGCLLVHVTVICM